MSHFRNDGFKKRWNAVAEKANQKRILIEQALIDSSAFDDAVLELESWIDAELTKNTATDSRVLGDIDTVKMLAEEHRKREAERAAKRRTLETVIARADQLSAKNTGESAHIAAVCDRVKEKWSRLEGEAQARSAAIEDAVVKATHFSDRVHQILDWLVEVEGKLAVSSTCVSFQLFAALFGMCTSGAGLRCFM